jgi:hypothetical protein
VVGNGGELAAKAVRVWETTAPSYARQIALLQSSPGRARHRRARPIRHEIRRRVWQLLTELPVSSR